MAIAPSCSNLDRFAARLAKRYSIPPLARGIAAVLPSDPNAAQTSLRILKQDAALAKVADHFRDAWPYGKSNSASSVGANRNTNAPEFHHLASAAWTIAAAWELQLPLEVGARQIVWRHAVSLAVAAREYCLAAQIEAAADEAFALGLSRGLGAFMLMREFGGDYIDFVKHLHRERGDWLTLERADLGFDHEQVATTLLDQWNWPNSRDGETSSPVEMVVPRALRFGTALCGLLLRGRSESFLELLDTTERWSARDGWDALEKLLEEVPAKARTLAAALGVSYPDDSVLLSPVTEAMARYEHASQDGSRGADSSRTDSGHDTCREGAGYLREEEFEQRISEAITACRQARSVISLALVELDEFPAWAATQTPEAIEQTINRFFDAAGDHLGNGHFPMPISPSAWAISLKGIDRPETVRRARQLMDVVRQWSTDARQRNEVSPSISIGLATLGVPPKNFPARDLIEAARRCLNGAKLSGGDTVKSIDA